MRIVNAASQSIDYCLNLLGIRVWENRCQLIAKDGAAWMPLGPERDLPIQVPGNVKDLGGAAEDALIMTAFQHQAEHPAADLVEVLAKEKHFSAALDEPARDS